MDTIQVRGARTHNLKNIDLEIIERKQKGKPYNHAKAFVKAVAKGKGEEKIVYN